MRRYTTLLIVSVSILAVLAAAALPTGQVIYEDGIFELPFQFLVTEAGTKNPLPEVKLHLYDDVRGEWHEIRTGPDGRAVIVIPCMVTCRTTKSVFGVHSRR